jgi:o-succinylbenzoate synthase
MIARIVSAEYSRSLPKPIVTSHGEYQNRAGIILAIWDDEGRVGLGEAAPLPGFSRESLEDVARSLASIQSAPPRSVEALMAMAAEHVKVPSLQFALECAALDLEAQARDITLAAVLAHEPLSSVQVNGLIGDGETSEMARRATELWAAEYMTFKVKVAAGDPARDLARINAITRAAPQAHLRLDANGGWDRDTAELVMSAIPIEHIEFLEQPFPVGLADSAKKLCAAHGVRLALDEEIDSISAGETIVSARGCDVIVLKPMILGSVLACHRLATTAVAQGMTAIYTSSWESDIGLGATLHLPAALGQEGLSMGLSTAGMIADGIIDRPLRIENARLLVPERSGLGLRLSSEFLSRLA